MPKTEAINAAERVPRRRERSPLAGIPPGPARARPGESYLAACRGSAPANLPPEPGPCWRTPGPPGEPVTAETLGQVLFDLVAWAMAHGLEAESALREANAAFAAEVAHQNWG